MWESIVIYILWALQGLVIFLWARWSERNTPPPLDEGNWILYLQYLL